MIGYFSKEIIGYVALNKKRAKSDLNHSKEDCRLNFTRSAKAIESKAVVLFTKYSQILIKCKLEVGIFIADNDNCFIRAVR